MIIQDNEPYLYNLLLQKQLNYTSICTGSFTVPKTHQICSSTGNSLDIYDISNGKIDPILSVDNINSTITSIGTINPQKNIEPQLAKILILSDSGNITILQFDPLNNTMKPIIIEPLMRSGMRRTTPLYHHTIDPQGKFIFMTAFSKFTYMYTIEYTNDNGNNQMKLSSPIGFARDSSIVSSVTVCDTKPYENPIFATIENSKNFNDPKQTLNFYTLDLNLNQILLLNSFNLKRQSFNFLPLPDLVKFGYINASNENDQEQSNPFILLATENHLLIKDMLGFHTIEIPIPHRNGDTRPIDMLSVDIQTIKDKDFIIILQTSNGDLLKLQFQKNSSSNILKASINYFDTLPHGDSLTIFPNGYMFVNSEFNDKLLLQFESLGSNKFEIQKTYKIHDKLQNLSLIDTLKTLNPLTSTSIITSKDNIITSFLTRSNDKSLRILSSSIKFDDLISSNLPPNPRNIWTLKQDPMTANKTNYHNLLVLGFENTTTFLQIEGNSIRDLKLPSTDTFIVQNDKTIHMNTMLGNTIIQVCSNSCNQISIKQNYKSILNWYPPAGITIVKADSTPTQLILALSNNDIIYMQIQPNGNIVESQKKLSMDTKITDISVYNDPGKPLEPCKFLIVGTDDKLINVISLQHDNNGNEDEDNFLEIISFMKLTDVPNSVLYTPGHIHAGLNNGIYSRSKIVDSGAKQIATGEIKDVWNKYIGVKKVTLSVIKRTVLSLTSNENEEDEEEDSDDDDDDDGNGEHKSKEDNDDERENHLTPCVLVTSDTTWASYQHKGNFYIRPIDFSSDIKGLSQVSEITTETLKFNGCCILSKSGKLIIGQFKDFIFNNKWLRMEEIPLSLDNDTNIKDEESDSDEEMDLQVDIQKFRNKITLPYNGYTIFIDNMVDDDDDKDYEKSVRISVLDSNMRFLEFVKDDNSKCNFQFFSNFTAITAKLINFAKGGNSNLILSTVERKLITYEISIKKSFFKLIELHTTEVDDRVNALCEFDNKLIVPIRNKLVIYSLGKTQLLKKAVHSTIPSTHIIVTIDNWKDKRIAVGDIQESVTIYQVLDDKFVAIASDVTKRHVVAAKFLDPYTVIGSDRFGNIWTLRVPEAAQDDKTSNIIVNNNDKKLSGNLIETPYQLKVLNHYYINDMVMDIFIVHNIHKSGRDCILYTGIQGTIGALIPIISKNEVTLLKKVEDNIADIEMTVSTFLNSDENDDDFKNLTGIDSEELQTIKDNKKKEHFPEGGYSLVGRDHEAYRGYYAPVRNIINGDLCETFQNLPTLEQNLICSKISKHNLTKEDILNAMNEVRTGYL
ncbi:pre-mRNA-splicing factor rse1 [Maudiozyma exigua]|uniref:Pre-mRNA-splicing factor rse1 n=1 Tax=Maudiozyma exigua TaxID=34358 RepID=A0A9P6VXJ3_MAUEX|nr:pre-mRNA-splicing factor rse1 [Kazachstania exigua]